MIEMRQNKMEKALDTCQKVCQELTSRLDIFFCFILNCLFHYIIGLKIYIPNVRRSPTAKSRLMSRKVIQET